MDSNRPPAIPCFSHGEGLPCLPDVVHDRRFSSWTLDRKVACVLAMRDICDELARYDALDLFRIHRLTVSDRGFRCRYGFSGSCSDDPPECRMRLAQIPDEVFEHIAAVIASLEFCSACRGGVPGWVCGDS